MSGRVILVSGSAVTLLFVLFCIWLGTLETCKTVEDSTECTTNLKAFLQSTPNEKGDALAGLAGSLAFLWLIITVLLQSKELELTRKEFSKVAIAQDEQVRLLKIQSDVLLKQGKREAEADAAAIGSEIAKLLNDRLTDLFSGTVFIETKAGQTAEYRILDQVKRNFSTGDDVRRLNAFSKLKLLVESLENIASTFIEPTNVTDSNLNDVIRLLSALTDALKRTGQKERLAQNADALEVSPNFLSRFRTVQ